MSGPVSLMRQLEADGVFWVGQLFSNSADSVESKNGHDCSTQWAVLKVIFMVLINAPLNKPCYTFTHPSCFWSATQRNTEEQNKDTCFGGYELKKQEMTAD